MNKQKHLIFSIFSLILIVCLSFANARPVLADEGAPTEPPVPAETDVPTEPPVAETAAPTEPPAEATPAPEEIPATVEEEEATVPELLAEVPENVSLVVLDESGEPVSLATQEAADIVVVGDPMWCPAGTLPGGTGCTDPYLTIAELVTELTGGNIGNYDQDGVIYFTSGATNGSLDLTQAALGNSEFATLNDFNLTLQGGWNGSTLGAATFTGLTDFGTNHIQVGSNSFAQRWVGNLTLNNFTFNQVSSTEAITLYTTNGDITLNNIQVIDQAGGQSTAFIRSTNGDIIVNNSSFDGDTSDQSSGFDALSTNGTIQITDTVFQGSRRNGNNAYRGAQLTAPTVILTDVTAMDNDGSGIEILDADTITLNNVIATLNGSSPSIGQNGSGVHITGTGTTIVSVTGGTFSNNFRYGVEVYDSAINELSTPTCSGNALATISACYNVALGSEADTTPPTLNLPADITVPATSGLGAFVTFTVSANDPEDGPVEVSCDSDSGDLFDIGTTPVECSASDSSGNTATGSFNVTVLPFTGGGGDDTTPPTLDLPGTITVPATSPGGAVVFFTVSANDPEDGPVGVTCDSDSGDLFDIGTTPVGCSASDSSGNTAVGIFNVIVEPTDESGPGGGETDPGDEEEDGEEEEGGEDEETSAEEDNESDSGANNFLIPVTSSESYGINCAVPAAFKVQVEGAEVVFNGLCGYEALVGGLDAATLPGATPDGATFVSGFMVDILKDGESVDPLPADSNIVIQFELPEDQLNEDYMVFRWDGEEWIEVASENLADGFLQITTDESGIFILVRK